MEVDEMDDENEENYFDTDSENDWQEHEFFAKKVIIHQNLHFDPIVKGRLENYYYGQIGGSDFRIVNMYAVVLEHDGGETVIKVSNDTYKYEMQNNHWKERELKITGKFLNYDRDVQMSHKQLYGELVSYHPQKVHWSRIMYRIS